MNPQSHPTNSLSQFSRRHFLHATCGCAAGTMLVPWLEAETPPGSGIGYIREKAPGFSLPPYAGTRSEAKVPATLDLTDMADLALRAMTGLANPAADHEVFWWAHLYSEPARMTHHGDYFILAEFMEAVPLLRTMTGSSHAEETDRAWVALALRCIGEDGLFYVPTKGRPWEPGAANGPEQKSNAWTCGRMMGALTVLYLRSGRDAFWGDVLKRMTDRLAALVIAEGEWAYFPSLGFSPGMERAKTGTPQMGLPATYTAWAVQGLAQFFRASGYQPAGRLARQLALYLKDHAKVFDARGRYLYSEQELKGLVAWKHVPQTNPEGVGGHHHHHSLGVLAIADYAIAAEDQALLRWSAASYEWARDHESASKTVGFFAEYLQRDYPSTETCEIADMISLAMKLSASGIGDYWDDADRYVRNQFRENQLTRYDWIQELPASERTASPAITPGESRDRVLERNVGTFSGWASGNEFTRLGQLMHCCVGNAGRALYHVWQHALTEHGGTLRVNLLLNRTSAVADIQSRIPYEGRVDVVVKRACREVLVRVPEWVPQDSADVSCTSGGQPRPFQWSGRHLSLGSVEAGSTLTITFPIAERTVRERIGGQDYTLIIKGSTVMAIEPQGKFNPLYQRDALRAKETQWVTGNVFTPDSEVAW